MTIKWLVFSDLHFKFENPDTVRLRKKLLDCLNKRKVQTDFILITGDCFYQGNFEEEQMENCQKYIEDILESSHCDRTNLYLIPGNHDLQRSVLRKKIIEDYMKPDKEMHEVTREEKDVLFNGFEKFRKLFYNLKGESYSGEAECYNKKGYRILSINTCIWAGTDQDEGNLSVYNKKLIQECASILENEKIEKDEKINIAFMHHGVEFLRPEEQIKFQHLMEDSHIDMVFTGHSHQIGVYTYDNTKLRIQQFTCGAPLADGYSKPSFLYCEYDTITHEVKCELFYYYKAITEWDMAKEHRAFQNGIYSFGLPRYAKSIGTNNEKIENSQLYGYGIVNALSMQDFYRIRKQLIEDAEGNIILAGQSLEIAFGLRDDSKSIISSLKNNKKIENIDIIITDPLVFDSNTDTVQGDAPITRLSNTMNAILTKVCESLQSGQTINIYFVPLVQLDHIVFVNDFLLLRQTLLWTNDSYYKTIPLLCRKVDESENKDKFIYEYSMYNVYLKYVDKLKADSIQIDVSERRIVEKGDSLAIKCLKRWENRLNQIDKSQGIKGRIILHKLYQKKLINGLQSTWGLVNEIGDDYNSFFHSDQTEKICDESDLFKSENLLDDSSQKVLIPYISETKNIMRKVVKTFDRNGEVHIIPSLNLGFPSYIAQLAGGFASGMFIAWKCDVPIVPIDIRSYVCSTSYYKFSQINLSGKNILDFFNADNINKVIRKGLDLGMPISFNLPDHFLMLCKSKDSSEYYLMINSSVPQNSNIYFGRNFTPHHWYSDAVERYQDKKTNRYFDYLKDLAAEKFIYKEKELKIENEYMHNWFAQELLGDIKPYLCKTYLHDGMPSDFTVAIGTYVIDKNDVVPIFTKEGKPFCMFRVSDDMWNIEINGKIKYIVPYNLGKTIQWNDLIGKTDINTKDLDMCKIAIDKDSVKLVLNERDSILLGALPNYRDIFDRKLISDRIMFGEDRYKGAKIFGNDIPLKGRVEEILEPLALFSEKTKGKVKYINEDLLS